jgi:hypothetical protein
MDRAESLIIEGMLEPSTVRAYPDRTQVLIRARIVKS